QVQDALHAHSLLNRSDASPSATVAKMASATISCQNAVMSAPLRTIERNATRKYRAGTMCVIHCTTVGMLVIGKMNPDRIIVGSSDDSSAIWNATCCVSAIVEISSPCACAPIRNKPIAPL